MVAGFRLCLAANLDEMNIVIIGGGNMGRAFIKGLTSSPSSSFNSIYVIEKNKDNKSICEKLNVPVFESFESLSKELSTSEQDLFLIAVKPNDVKQVIQASINSFPKIKTYISIAAGITINSIQSVSDKIEVARAMPNLGASNQQSATAVSFSSNYSQEMQSTAISILETIGKVFVVEEKFINLITAVSGSGPAYYFYLSEQLEKFAIANGIDKEVAQGLVEQTLKAAASVLIEGIDFSELREQVTSPGGTTHAAIESFKDNNFEQILASGLKAALDRAEQLSVEESPTK